MKFTICFALLFACGQSIFAANLPATENTQMAQKRLKVQIEKRVKYINQEIVNTEKSIAELERAPQVNKAPIANHKKYLAKLEFALVYNQGRLDDLNQKPAIKIVDAQTMLSPREDMKNTQEKLLLEVAQTIKEMNIKPADAGLDSRLFSPASGALIPDYSKQSKLELEVDLTIEQSRLRMTQERLKRIPEGTPEHKKCANELEFHKRVIATIEQELAKKETQN